MSFAATEPPEPVIRDFSAPTTLIGTWLTTIDDKARINIPINIRRSFFEGVVARLLNVGCISLSPKPEFEIRATYLEQRLDACSLAAHYLPQDPKVEEAEEALRLFTYQVDGCSWDETGRLGFSAPMREAAGIVASSREIKNSSLLVGTGRRVEVWNPTKYEEYIADKSAKRRAASGDK